MKTIYKYPLEITYVQTVDLPIDHQILHVDNQGGVMTMWALVHVGPDVVTYPKKLMIAGTGNPFPDGRFRHVGSVLIDPFVWHVFEVL